MSNAPFDPNQPQPYGQQPYQGQAHPYQGTPPGYQPPPVPAKRRRRWFTRALFLVPLAFILGLIFGSIGGSGGGSTVAAADPAGSVTVPGPTTTVTTAGKAGSSTTVTAKPEPAPTVTVTQTKKAAPPEPAPTVTVTEQGEAPVEDTTEDTEEFDGTYKVGDDIKPGHYKATGAESGNCYWARLKGDSGDLDDIISNNNSSGSTRVTIKNSDKFFETSGCTGWKKL